MASSAPSLPVSRLITTKSSVGTEEPQKKTREDWRKAKELEEARKAGTAPAAVDEEGRDINPHIPQYISAVPWYYTANGPTLKHQRPQDEDSQKNLARVGEWFQRGVNTDSIATRYRKGACENCGAMTHKRKDCMERPRRIGARFSGAEIAPDEFVQPNLKLDFDGKRDRWNGYDPVEHSGIVEEFQKIEDAKRQLKAQRLDKGDEEDGEEDEDEDEDKYVDEVDMPGTKVDSKQRITVRNLRIREDTAKYLRNLDPNSAYYDPKTRSMRDNPYKDTGKGPELVDYAGENFIRYSGDTSKHAEAQMFAWEAQNAGVDVHLLAEPTKAEKLKVEYVGKKEEIKSTIQDSVLERYGGRDHLQVPPKALLLAQTENYVEYSRAGKIIKGAEKPVARSRYEEDVYPNNHHSVWGSFWKDGAWGYQCCHSLVKNSYCTGERGKDDIPPPVVSSAPPAAITVPAIAGRSRPDSDQDDDDDDDDDDVQEQRILAKRKADVVEEKTDEQLLQEKEERQRSDERRRKKRDRKKRRKEKKQRRKRRDTSSSDSSDSSDEEEAKKRRLQKAVRQEEERLRKVDKLLAMDERKRPYNSMAPVHEPTELELEAYHMKRKRDEDPMAAFM